MEEPSDTWMDRIQEGIALVHAGELAEARRFFDALWPQVEAHGDALHRCVLAHFMADTQDDPAEELAWDLRALAAAESLTSTHVRVGGAALSLASFFPSLHLNAGESFRKVGDRANALAHAALASDAARALGGDSRAKALRAAIARLVERLGAPDASVEEDAPGVRLRTRRWNDPPEDADGFRLLVSRYRPRGVRREDETWDAWWPDLGPSRELHAAYYGKRGPAIAWEEYRARYLDEMRRQESTLARIAGRLAAGDTWTLLCASSCTDESRCHRTLLAALLRARVRRGG